MHKKLLFCYLFSRWSAVCARASGGVARTPRARGPRTDWLRRTFSTQTHPTTLRLPEINKKNNNFKYFTLFNNVLGPTI